MSYKNLKNFKKILIRDDFNHLVDNADEIISNIKSIKFMNKSALLSTQKKLGDYLNNFSSFVKWIDPSGKAPTIFAAFMQCKEILQFLINMIKKQPEKISLISGGKLRTEKKKFEYGLNKLLVGLRLAFNNKLVGELNITKDQLSFYIINEIEGLGKRYKFHDTSMHAFKKKIETLNKQELVATERLLEEQQQKRTFNGWLDLGSKGNLVRILINQKKIGRDEVYFLYRINEHPAYSAQLRVPPNAITFSP